MTSTTPRSVVRCGACDRPIRRNATYTTFRWANGLRTPVHATCRHRLTTDPDACGCDICTGDLH